MISGLLYPRHHLKQTLKPLPGVVWGHAQPDPGCAHCALTIALCDTEHPAVLSIPFTRLSLCQPPPPLQPGWSPGPAEEVVYTARAARHCISTYRVAGATAQETALLTHALSQAPLPCPGHLCPSKLQHRPGWLPITIATAAHELLGERVLTRRRRATEGHLVTGSQHRFSATCLTWVTASDLGILSLKTRPMLPHCPSVSMLTQGLSKLVLAVMGDGRMAGDAQV